MLEDVIHETIILDIILKRYYSIIAFNVIKPSSKPLIIGLSWLNKFNPTID